MRFRFPRAQAAPASAAVVSSVAPSWGSEDGGTTVWVTVDDSTGITSGSIGGVAVTGLTIVDATTVRCVTGAHAAGLGDVVMTNAAGASDPLADGFLYFDPTDANYAPAQAVIAPEYDDTNETAGGIWHARTGSDLSAGVNPGPAADGGAVQFDGEPTTNPLLSPDTVATWYGSGDHHVVAALDIASIPNDDTGNVYGNAAVFVDSNAVVGLTLYRTGAGPYSYFATLFEHDGGFKAATLDISALVDEDGASLAPITIEAKKSGGNLHIRANDGEWTVGDACGALSSATGTLLLGRGYGGARIDATIRALILNGAANDAAYSSLVSEWGSRVPSGWVRRSANTMPAGYEIRMSAATFRLASGRLLIVGGFNHTTLAAWNDEWVTNEVWASDDNGDTWFKLLAHDSDPDATGPAARFRPCHSVAYCTMNGVAYMAGVDPTFQTTQSGHVWRSVDGETWEVMTTTAPCQGRMMHMMGAIGSTLYMGGGQADTLDESTRIRDWWKSEDNGVTWTEMALPPWSARGMIYQLPTIGGKLYLIGGGVYDQEDPATFVGVYTFDGTDWVEILPDTHEQFPAYWYTTPIELHGRIWVFGGFDHVSVGSMYFGIYSDDLGATWSEFVPGPGGKGDGGGSHSDTIIAADNRIVRVPGFADNYTDGATIYTIELESAA